MPAAPAPEPAPRTADGIATSELQHLRANGLRGGHAVHAAGQLNVHQHQIRLQLPGQLNRLLTTGGVAYRLKTQLPQLHGNVHGNNHLVFNNENSGSIQGSRHGLIRK
jgi:hypothetical protein